MSSDYKEKKIGDTSNEKPNEQPNEQIDIEKIDVHLKYDNHDKSVISKNSNNVNNQNISKGSLSKNSDKKKLKILIKLFYLKLQNFKKLD